MFTSVCLNVFKKSFVVRKVKKFNYYFVHCLESIVSVASKFHSLQVLLHRRDAKSRVEMVILKVLVALWRISELLSQLILSMKSGMFFFDCNSEYVVLARS